MPLSVKVAQPSRPPDTSFLVNKRRTWIMGVLNVTPDSFYAASRVSRLDGAVSLAAGMVHHGADLLDIGGESTRPGSKVVPSSQELDRVLPVLEALHAQWPNIPISIDTQKADVAREVLARGAVVINDISALRADPGMADVVSAARCPVVLMHMQGTPESMQAHPHYENVVDDVKRFFEERLVYCSRHSISEESVILDPGIGFGKTLEHNMDLLKHLSEFLVFGRPLLVGLSRKSFLARLFGNEESPLPPEERLEGSLAAALWAVQQGARGLRVHDVAATCRAVRTWERIEHS